MCHLISVLSLFLFHFYFIFFFVFVLLLHVNLFDIVVLMCNVFENEVVHLKMFIQSQ